MKLTVAVLFLIILSIPVSTADPVTIEKSPEPAKIFETYKHTVIFNSGGGQYYCVGDQTANCFTTVADAHGFVDDLVSMEKSYRQQQAQQQADLNAQIKANQIQSQIRANQAAMDNSRTSKAAWIFVAGAILFAVVVLSQKGR